MPPNRNYASFENRLKRVMVHIYENLDDDSSLDALADIACMSRHHWHRIFKAMTGETLAEAVRRLRLHKAAILLVQEDTPVSKIAERVGYPNPASFSRAFSATYGMSPNSFRNNGTEVTDLIRCKTSEDKMFPVTIHDYPTLDAAGVLHIGSYKKIGLAFQQLGSILMARSLIFETKALFTIYHDQPESKPDAELRSHVAVVTGNKFPNALEGLDYFQVSGGKYAVLEHKGPYATLEKAYTWLYGTWLPNSDEEPRDDPPLEVYVNDPKSTPPADLRTDIRLPLA